MKRSHLQDVRRVVFSPAPSPQVHASVHWVKTSTGLRGEQVIFWELTMDDVQGELRRDQSVKVPVERYAVDVPRGMNITEYLHGRGQTPGGT